ncbi:MAG: NAD(P)-binding domain-containing protein [Gordonia sp. (in: high G+C Gram-positive bacteria)]
MRIGFIGVGSIARAIVEGLCTGDAPPEILLAPRSASVSAELAERFPTVRVCADNDAVVDASDIVFLALRTEHCPGVVADLAFRADQIIVDVMISVGLEQLRAMLPEHSRAVTIVRAMPLQEVRRRDCVTVVYPPDPRIEELFGPLGGALAVDGEAAFTAFGVLSATMSSYYAYLASIASWAAEQGVPAGDADRFLRSLFGGAGRALDENDTPFDALRAEHETPGGANERIREQWFTASQPSLQTVLDELLASLSD